METLVSIGLVQVLAVISPGPSFLITVRTAAARSSLDGLKVALGLGAGAITWAAAAMLGLGTGLVYADAHHAIPNRLAEQGTAK